MKTPLASWCDGTHTTAEKPCLIKDNVDCVFRSVPFNYIGVDSDGKCIHTTKSLMQQVALSDFYRPKRENEVKEKPKR